MQRAGRTDELNSGKDDSHDRLAGHQRLDDSGAKERSHGYHGCLKIGTRGCQRDPCHDDERSENALWEVDEGAQCKEARE